MARLIRQNGTSEEVDMSLAVKPIEQEAAIKLALISKHVIDLEGLSYAFKIWKCPEHSVAFKEGHVYLAALVGSGMDLKSSLRAQNYSGKCQVATDNSKLLSGPMLFLKADEIGSRLVAEKKRWK